MTKEELERIKQAYYSGLKVQIWFNGHWENFDARDYSMYADPFSENRQYRVVGSAYADIAEKRIAELEKKISILLSCKDCPDNKGGYICQKEYEDKCLSQKIQYIKELKEENKELKEEIKKSSTNIGEVYVEQPYKGSPLEKKKQLEQAKELLKDITSSYGSTEVSEAQLYLKIKRAEQFLKKCE